MKIYEGGRAEFYFSWTSNTVGHGWGGIRLVSGYGFHLAETAGIDDVLHCHMVGRLCVGTGLEENG